MVEKETGQGKIRYEAAKQLERREQRKTANSDKAGGAGANSIRGPIGGQVGGLVGPKRRL